MKKVFLALMVVGFLASCSNGTGSITTTDSTKVDTTKVTVDTVKVDSTKATLVAPK